MANPYAPPLAAVRDVVDPRAHVDPADRGTRLGAAILDSIIFFGMVYVPFFASALLGGATGSPDDAVNTALAVGGVLAVVGFIVWCWLTIKYMKDNGQSIAKKMMAIKVVRSDGTPVSLARLIWMRNVLVWAISVVPLFSVIDSLFIFGEARQCLHDKIADTIVVKA